MFRPLVFLSCLAALAACGEARTGTLSKNGVRDAGVVVRDAGSAPVDGGSTNCAGLGENQCLATSECEADRCADCTGGTSFFSCRSVGSIPSGCPPIFCEECIDLDESRCIENSPRCRTNTCFDCDGHPYFSVCTEENQIDVCPDLVCPPTECGELGEERCAASAECHRVFTDQPLTCDCDSPGCCQVFDYCASGDAFCSDENLGCRRTPPNCEGPYVISYVFNCYEGCVLATDCRP